MIRAASAGMDCFRHEPLDGTKKGNGIKERISWASQCRESMFAQYAWCADKCCTQHW